ncbi:MAG: restriction endonuclease subunit S [Fibrobacterales bacterium]|nr:restriction endonuclease subunit S [Fibrobacterales bacterium]
MNSLPEHKFKEFLLTDIFSVEYGNKFDLNKMETFPTSSIAFVSRTAQNNGISAYVEPIPGVAPYPAGAITVALGGSIGSTFLQKQPFYTGQNVSVLLPKTSMSDAAKLFVSCIIMTECSYRFVAFGRELNKHIKRDFTIKLPQSSSGLPDWQIMSNFIAELEEKENNGGGTFANALETRNCEIDATVRTDDWGEFKVGELFEVEKGDRLTKEDQTDGNTPYVGAIDSNNGVSNRIGQEAIHQGGTISLSYNGSVGEAFYQPEPFWATDDVNVLYPKPATRLNQWTALFVCTVLRQEKYRYSYGRKWVLEAMNDTIIRLPQTPDGKPDWDEMERMIKALPYGDRI